MWAVHYLLKRDLSGSMDSTFRLLNDQKLFGKVDFLKPRCNLKRYNFNNSIHVMLEFVSKLKFYFAPRKKFCPIDWHISIRHFKNLNFYLIFALSLLLHYLCFWCLYSIRMGSFVPVTTFNNDLTLKNRRLRHILKETEKFAEYVDEFDSSRLWILYRTRSDANDHKEYLSFY